MYQNSESFRKFLSETSLTQNCSMGYIYFRLDLTLAHTMHMRRRFGTRNAHTKEVPVSNPITLRNFVWNMVLKSSERD